MVYKHIRDFFTNYVLYYATWLLVIYVNVTGLEDFWATTRTAMYAGPKYPDSHGVTFEMPNEHSIHNLFPPIIISMFAYTDLYKKKNPLPVLAYFSFLKLVEFIIDAIFMVDISFFNGLVCFVLVVSVALFVLPERLFTLWGAPIRTIQDKITFMLQFTAGILSAVIHMELVKYFDLTNTYLTGFIGIACFVATTTLSNWLVNKLFTRELGVFIYNQIKEDLPDLKELELSTNITVVDSPNDVCAICLDDFYDRSNITCQLNCKHFYHVECLKKQRKVSVNPIRDKCPMCRISYDTVVQQVYVEEPRNDLVVVGQKTEAESNAVWQKIKKSDIDYLRIGCIK